MPKDSSFRPIGLIIPQIGSHKCPSMVSKIPLIGLIIAPVPSQLNLTSGLFTPDSSPAIGSPETTCNVLGVMRCIHLISRAPLLGFAAPLQSDAAG